MPDSSGMHRRRGSVSVVLLAVAGAFTGASAASPVASAALTGPQQIDALNAQRAKHGIPAGIAEVPAWSAACKKHMDYLAATGKFQHAEDKTDAQYSDEGNWGGNHSVLVSAGDAFRAGGVNAFEHAPIHLMQMLSPFMTRSGADRGCLVTLGDGSRLEGPPSTERVFTTPRTFSYPGNGVTDVPVSEDTYEFPFVPAASVGLNVAGDVTRSRGTGPHLYVFYGGPSTKPGPQSWWSRGVITAASLTGPAGAVEVKTVDHATAAPPSVGGTIGGYLAPGGIVIPVKPLAPGTTYAAAVTFDPNGADPVTFNWSFKTAGTVAAPSTPSSPATPATPSNPPAPSTPSGAGTIVTIPAGETTIIWNSTPSKSEPLPRLPNGVEPGAPIPSVERLELTARSVRFVAPITGRVKVSVRRMVPRKDGTKRSETKLSKTIKVKHLKVVKLRAPRTFPRGEYLVSVVRAGTR